MDTLSEAISRELKVAPALAEHLANVAERVWDVMAAEGMVDGYGGAECVRVLPAALSFIRQQANQIPGCPPPVWS